MDTSIILGSGIGLIITALVITTFILWIFLPFAVFGFQKKLDKINENLVTMYKLHEQMLQQAEPTTPTNQLKSIRSDRFKN